MRKYLIYIIKNKINNKVYIGQTCQSAKERFAQHMKPSVCKKRGSYKIYNAIEKYGKENFYYEVLEDNINSEDIDEKEIKYISVYDSYNNGYNSTQGGDSKTICKVNDIQILKELYSKGKTYSEIAEYFNVNEVTIQRTLHSLGIRRYEPITKEYLMKNKDSKTNKQMADELGVSPATITRYLQKYNISRGRGSSNILNQQNQSKITKSDLLKYIHLSNKEMGDILGVDKTYISKLLKKYDISKRKYK